MTLPATTERRALVNLAWHDATCAEAEDCRDRVMHSAANPIANSGVLEDFIERLNRLACERFPVRWIEGATR